LRLPLGTACASRVFRLKFLQQRYSVSLSATLSVCRELCDMALATFTLKAIAVLSTQDRPLTQVDPGQITK
jgi:hypothetical protein